MSETQVSVTIDLSALFCWRDDEDDDGDVDEDNDFFTKALYFSISYNEIFQKLLKCDKHFSISCKLSIKYENPWKLNIFSYYCFYNYYYFMIIVVCISMIAVIFFWLLLLPSWLLLFFFDCYYYLHDCFILLHGYCGFYFYLFYHFIFILIFLLIFWFCYWYLYCFYRFLHIIIIEYNMKQKSKFQFIL